MSILNLFGFLEYAGYGGGGQNANVGYVDYSQPPPSTGGYQQPSYNQNSSWNQSAAPASAGYGAPQCKSVSLLYFIDTISSVLF